MNEGERIASSSIARSWSVKKLADEINAAILRANPVSDLAGRPMPPVLDAYMPKPDATPKHIKDDL